MSMVFAREAGVRQKLSPSHSTVQKLLDENAMLIQTIADYQNAGRLQEAIEYQQTLHRNLVYLANLADGAQALLAELQAPFDAVSVSTSSQSQNVTGNAVPETQGFPPDKENRPPPTTTQQYSNSDQMRSQQMNAMHNMPATGTAGGGNGYYGENQPQAHASQQSQMPQHQQQPTQAPGNSGGPQMGGQTGQQQQSMPQPVSIGYSQQMPMGPPPQQAPTGQQQQQQPPQSYYQQPYQQQQMVGPPPPQSQQQQAYQPGPQTYQTTRPQASGGPMHGGDSAAVYYSGQPRYQQQPGVTQQHSMHMGYQQQTAPGVYQQAPVGPGPAMYGQQVRAGGYPQQQQPQYGQQMGPPGAPPDQQQMYGHPAYHGAQVYHAYQQQQQPQQHMAPPQQQQQQAYSNMPPSS